MAGHEVKTDGSFLNNLFWFNFTWDYYRKREGTTGPAWRDEGRPFSEGRSQTTGALGFGDTWKGTTTKGCDRARWGKGESNCDDTHFTGTGGFPFNKFEPGGGNQLSGE